MKLGGNILKVLIRGIVGLVGVYFVNQYLDTYDLVVGINPYTGGIVGLLGLHGFIMLYLLVFLDKKIF